MSKYCAFDRELLAERPSAQTSGEPSYVCSACGRVYEMRYPASATGSEHLALVYDPERRSDPRYGVWLKGAADG